MSIPWTMVKALQKERRENWKKKVFAEMSGKPELKFDIDKLAEDCRITAQKYSLWNDSKVIAYAIQRLTKNEHENLPGEFDVKRPFLSDITSVFKFIFKGRN